jgi:hypothetical protein
MSGGSINVYGLWASNSTAVAPSLGTNFFPAGSFPKMAYWQSSVGNCDAWDPSRAVMNASMEPNAYKGYPAMVLSGSYGNACESTPIQMPSSLVGGDTFLVRLAAETQGTLAQGPNVCIWDSQANECLPHVWSPTDTANNNWTMFDITFTLPFTYVHGNNLGLYLYSGETDGGPPAVNAYADIQMFK